MTTQEERMQILRMVQEGKLSPEEAASLMEAIDGATPPTEKPAPAAPKAAHGAPRWFRVRVTDTVSGKASVNLRMPVGMISAGLKIGARFSPDMRDLNVDALTEAIEAGQIGQVVDVYDDEDHERVEIFLE